MPDSGSDGSDGPDGSNGSEGSDGPDGSDGSEGSDHRKATLNLARLDPAGESTPFDTGSGTTVAAATTDIVEVEMETAAGDGPSR